MHSIRPRPTCRAHNAFSPSVALWQHFVAPNQYLPQRPHNSLFATEASQSRDDETIDPKKEASGAGSDPALFRKVKVDSQFISTNILQSEFQAKAKTPLQDDGQNNKRTLGVTRRAIRSDTEVILEKAHEAYNSSQDYEGVVVQPVNSIPIREHTYPWVVQKRGGIEKGEERLNLEIQNFHKYIRPNSAESVARKHVIEQVRQHVREFLPEHVLEVFGSERTGIAFANSDIDLRLVPTKDYSDTAQAQLPPNFEERKNRREVLKSLYNHLWGNHRKSYQLPKMRWARYPLISVQDRASGLDVQIVLANDTSLSRQYMQHYMDEYPYLACLYSVIKATLDVRGLSDVFRGGIGSYSLFMMIVASLKHQPHPQNHAASDLMHFLRFWSNFKAEMHSLSIEPPEFLPKSDPIMHWKTIKDLEQGKTAPLPPWMVTLRDPADKTNDLGRKTVAWKHIQKTFMSLHKNSRSEVSQNTRISLLARYVGPIYALQKQHRKRLSEFGQSLSEAGRQYRPSVIAKQAVETGPGEDAVTGSLATPDLDELAAIARSIRTGWAARKESPSGAETLETAKDAAQKGEVSETNPWLKDIEEASDHKQTGEAFSNLLGLDKKAD